VVCHMLGDTCFTVASAAAGSTSTLRASSTSVAEDKGVAAPTPRAPSPKKDGESGEVGGCWWYVTCLLTVALQVRPLLLAIHLAPARQAGAGQWMKATQRHRRVHHRQRRMERAVMGCRWYVTCWVTRALQLQALLLVLRQLCARLVRPLQRIKASQRQRHVHHRQRRMERAVRWGGVGGMSRVC
jgi:hypothetical protein